MYLTNYNAVPEDMIPELEAISLVIKLVQV